ncbi:nuclear transport factor 2 family protein [Thalassoroseus pseudoceratinae]|uniref:nuclear transport factor 2 family protein n=1 Tax=Thalassoroseus pseudoceratinae TaxID=2713176 RepID=UPI001422E5A4|nr:nuclear transport factor 2 family protein [Thalassoroseus pseudoceratinae]
MQRLTLGILIVVFGQQGCDQLRPADPSAKATENSQLVPAESSKTPPGWTTSKTLSVAEASWLIPSAAACSREQFDEVLRHPPTLLSDIDDQKLTLLLLAYDPSLVAQTAPTALDEFRYTGPFGAKKDDIVEAVYGDGKPAYASVIRPSYITDCTCNSDGDQATGVVAFRAVGVFEGRCRYTAEREDGKWRVVEFYLPSYRIRTRRQADGLWKLVDTPVPTGPPSY